MFKVLRDWKGSPDGFTVIEYKTGQIVELHSSLTDVALAEGWVENFTEPSVYATALKTWVGDTVPGKPRRHKRK